MGEWVAGFWIVDAGTAVTLLCLWKLWVVLKKNHIPFKDRVKAALARVWG